VGCWKRGLVSLVVLVVYSAIGEVWLLQGSQRTTGCIVEVGSGCLGRTWAAVAVIAGFLCWRVTKKMTLTYNLLDRNFECEREGGALTASGSHKARTLLLLAYDKDHTIHAISSQTGLQTLKVTYSLPLLDTLRSRLRWRAIHAILTHSSPQKPPLPNLATVTEGSAHSDESTTGMS